MSKKSPKLYIIAGPNGAGKTTFAKGDEGMKKDSRLKRAIHLLNLKAEKALKKAVAETIRDHARTGDPVVVWRNGKVVWVPAKRLLKQQRKK